MAEMARKYSITPEAENDGVLGWIDQGTSAIYDKAFKLGKGQRTQVLKSEYGYHIIEVIDRKSERTLPLSEVEAKIKEILMQKEQQQKYSEWIEHELKQSSVYKDQELIDAVTIKTRG